MAPESIYKLRQTYIVRHALYTRHYRVISYSSDFRSLLDMYIFLSQKGFTIFIYDLRHLPRQPITAGVV